MIPLLVFGSLCGFALFCVLVSAAVAGVRRRLRERRQRRRPRKLLVHSINDDRCTGCEACVTVCPTDVLALSTNKSRAVRFEDCIQCEQCVTACPTTALVMHYQGTEPPPIRAPRLDDYYQAAPGLYLIGEAGGKPLVKNAINLGRAVVEHMLATGLRPAAGGADEVDVLIVGSGPGGLSAALSCAAGGLRYALLEKDELVAATIARWPKGKECMAEPYDVKCVGPLPVWDCGRDELLSAWRTLLERNQIKVATREVVEEVQRDGARFSVRTNQRLWTAKRVVLAIGTRGKPRKLGVPGEELAKVTPLLTDPAEHRGQRVLVVGGGDSAVEAAIALSESAQKVTLSYRGKQLSRCKAKNRQRLDELVQAGRATLRYGTQVHEITPDTVVLKAGEHYDTLANDHVFVCIGGDAPVKWLQSVGVEFVEQPHLFERGRTDELVERLVGPLADHSPSGAASPPSGPGAQPLAEVPTVLRFPTERVRRTA